MNFKELQKNCFDLYRPAILLDDHISNSKRKNIEIFLKFTTIFLFFVSLIFIFATVFPSLNLKSSLPLNISSKVIGLFSISLSFWLFFICLRFFYNSYYFSDKKSKDTIYLDYDLAYAITETGEKDPAGLFFKTLIGRNVMLRFGVTPVELSKFWNERKETVSDLNLDISTLSSDMIKLENILLAFVDADQALKDFLFNHGIQKKEIKAVADWIEETMIAQKFSKRWWSDENLSRISGVGRDWSYGEIWQLEKFQKPLYVPKNVRYQIHSSYGVDEILELENILSRSREANALLVGNDESGKTNMVAHLSVMIDESEVLAALRHKRVIVFDTDLFISAHGNKNDFEQSLESILLEAEKAGNVILVMENFPAFVLSAKSFGSDLASLFGNFLGSSHIQIIAFSDNERFHALLEPNTALMQHFEKIIIKEIDEDNTIKVLENELENFENKKFFFTYPALVSIADSAKRYFPDALLPDKAIDLLVELSPKLLAAGKTLVEKKDVLELVEKKTGIPTGEIDEKEKDKLLNLETILHERIIGQDEAVIAISNAMRRARSGIENPDRPMGSFLFLGPTGVGKTETSKALSKVFFGDESHIIRLDMSEYSSFDAVSKLIGSFENKQTGVLSTILREHPYGVLLLDEFEKTTKEVMNLFLQILDEGFFSDMNGHKINARNLIIIATSNAGSDMIWNAMKDGKNLSDEKSKIIDTMIGQGTFKPELLNRFDGVILFHPLEEKHLREVARLMLQKLQKRLSEKGMDLVISDAIIDFLVSEGSDPKFGARPLGRAIEDKIEQIISKKIIAGSLGPGSKISLTARDLK